MSSDPTTKIVTDTGDVVDLLLLQEIRKLREQLDAFAPLSAQVAENARAVERNAQTSGEILAMVQRVTASLEEERAERKANTEARHALSGALKVAGALFVASLTGACGWAYHQTVSVQRLDSRVEALGERVEATKIVARRTYMLPVPEDDDE